MGFFAVRFSLPPAEYPCPRDGKRYECLNNPAIRFIGLAQTQALGAVELTTRLVRVLVLQLGTPRIVSNISIPELALMRITHTTHQGASEGRHHHHHCNTHRSFPVNPVVTPRISSYFLTVGGCLTVPCQMHDHACIQTEQNRTEQLSPPQREIYHCLLSVSPGQPKQPGPEKLPPWEKCICMDIHIYVFQ
jgi:hypothetical protein